MSLILMYWRQIAMVALLVAAWMHGHSVGSRNMDAHWQAIFSKQEAQFALQSTAATNAAREQEQKWATTASLIEDNGYQSLQEKTRENDSLRDAVESQRVQLRLAAHCPTDLPASATGGGVDHGAGPQLDAGARQHYFALRRGIVTVDQQLSACQAELVNDRKLIP